MAKNRIPKPPTLSGQKQSSMLLFHRPEFRLIAQGNPYVWEGPIQPTDLSATYTIRVTLRARKRPIVEVLAPILFARLDCEAIPHTFSSGSLCLHINGGWVRSQFLHETILPWSSLWLYFYEIWHATGDWLGGGHQCKPEALDDAVLDSNC